MSLPGLGSVSDISWTGGDRYLNTWRPSAGGCQPAAGAESSSGDVGPNLRDFVTASEQITTAIAMLPSR